MTIHASDEQDGIRLTFDHEHEVDVRAFKVSYQTVRQLVAALLMVPGMQWRPGDPKLGEEGE